MLNYGTMQPRIFHTNVVLSNDGWGIINTLKSQLVIYLTVPWCWVELGQCLEGTLDCCCCILSSSLFPLRSHWNPTGRMCVVMSPAVIIAINTFGLTEATCNYFLWTEIFSGQLTTMIHRCLHHEDLELVHASYLSVPTSCCLNTECFCGSFIYLSSFWSKPDKIIV